MTKKEDCKKNIKEDMKEEVIETLCYNGGNFTNKPDNHPGMKESWSFYSKINSKSSQFSSAQVLHTKNNFLNSESTDEDAFIAYDGMSIGNNNASGEALDFEKLIIQTSMGALNAEKYYNTKHLVDDTHTQLDEAVFLITWSEGFSDWIVKGVRITYHNDLAPYYWRTVEIIGYKKTNEIDCLKMSVKRLENRMKKMKMNKCKNKENRNKKRNRQYKC